MLGVLEFFINTNLDIDKNIIDDKFNLNEYLGQIIDAEDNAQKLYVFSSSFNVNDEFELIDKIIDKLQNIFINYCRDNSKEINEQSFKR